MWEELIYGSCLVLTVSDLGWPQPLESSWYNATQELGMKKEKKKKGKKERGKGKEKETEGKGKKRKKKKRKKCV